MFKITQKKIRILEKILKFNAHTKIKQIISHFKLAKDLLSVTLKIPNVKLSKSWIF